MPSTSPTRIGFIGAGWMGRVLMQRVSERHDALITALHQRSTESARETLKELELTGVRVEARCEDLVNAPDVDAVFVCSTNEAHGPQSIAALKAGKHVFCEKPCATRFDDFRRQVELARAHPELVTFVDYLMNFDALEHRLREMAARGTFGTITQIQVNYRHPVNIEGAKAWKLRSGSIGDAIGMGIVHSLSVMLNLMASNGAKPVSVFATSSDRHVRPFEVPAIWNIQVGFDNGGTGFCFGNIDQANGYDAGHNIHGTQGGLIFDSYLDRPQKVRYWSETETDGRWIYPLDRARAAAEETEDLLWPADTTTPDSGDVMNHQTGACVDHFITCVRKGEPSFLGFDASAGVAELGWAAQMSAALRRPIDLPLNWDDAATFFHHRESA